MATLFNRNRDVWYIELDENTVCLFNAKSKREAEVKAKRLNDVEEYPDMGEPHKGIPADLQ